MYINPFTKIHRKDNSRSPYICTKCRIIVKPSNFKTREKQHYCRDTNKCKKVIVDKVIDFTLSTNSILKKYKNCQ